MQVYRAKLTSSGQLGNRRYMCEIVTTHSGCYCRQQHIVANKTILVNYLFSPQTFIRSHLDPQLFARSHLAPRTFIKSHLTLQFFPDFTLPLKL